MFMTKQVERTADFCCMPQRKVQNLVGKDFFFINVQEHGAYTYVSLKRWTLFADKCKVKEKLHSSNNLVILNEKNAVTVNNLPSVYSLKLHMNWKYFYMSGKLIKFPASQLWLLSLCIYHIIFPFFCFFLPMSTEEERLGYTISKCGMWRYLPALF